MVSGAGVRRKRAIDQLARQRIAADGVEGEVAPRGGFGGRHGGVALDLEIGVFGADARFAAGKGDVDRMAFQDEDAEGAAHGIEPVVRAQGGFDGFGVEAVNLHVDVFGGEAEQPVAHAAAHEEGAPAGVGEEVGDGEDVVAPVGRDLVEEVHEWMLSVRGRERRVVSGVSDRNGCSPAAR